MKKSAITAAALIIVFAAIGLGIWFAPVRPLKGCKPEDITMIKIYYINKDTMLTDEKEVRTIAENIYSCGAKRSAISFGRMGSVYKLGFYKGDECISTFSLCGEDCARDAFFFYSPINGSYCKDYLDTVAFKHLA